MAQGKISVGFWVLISTLLVGGGIGAYFLFRKPKDESNVDESNVDESDTQFSTSVKPSSKPIAPAELNTTAKIKAFQDWMDKEGKGWILKDGKWGFLNKGAGYGNYGKSTDAVWKVYGKDNLKSLSTSTPTSQPVSKTNLSKDIDTIIKSSTGTKAEKSYLQKTNANFVSTWAKAITNNKKAFIWANQVYRTKTGVKILDFNPIGRTWYAKITGGIGKTTPNDSASAYNVTIGTPLGSAKGIDFNNGLWLFLPESGSVFKWYKINNVTLVNPNSSFEGDNNNNVEFSSFDNNFDLNI